ncbi:wax ester synthase/diacylglycerol acyltransferase 8 isoform X2 [Cryptomeria japonica]|uniref:wax ester synthase/diacylglycerol acyltransferase 8 isoform X2 n=1 Tax=Cryptomeria japonica TaxID=3369 RepID=UPI0027DA59C4|nr:wax ester synthase/diacylglycerol acyltransferase 8 isoform X2 [Cryptomeria japonica]
MKTANSISLVESKLACPENTRDDGDGLEEANIQLSEIVVKKADDVNHMVNISKHEEPLSPAACIASNTLVDSYILTIVGFKKEIDINSLKISLQNNLGEHQRFSSIVVKDKHNNLKWCLREVVIEEHVIVPSLSPSIAENPYLVNEYTSSLVTAPPLNPCKPLWEVHVLNVPSEDAAASLVFRIHHSLGDCISMVSLILNSTSKANNNSQAPPTIPQRTTADQRPKGFLQIVYNVLVRLWLTFVFLHEVGITLLWKHDRNLLIGGRRADVCSKRLAYVTLGMDDICFVKKAVNGALNDVIMGALSAGLVRYMSRQQNDQVKNNSVPQRATTHKNSRLRAMVAVNMRQFPILKLAAYLSKKFTTILTLGFSNVMGPVEEIQYGDNPVAHIIPTAHVNNCSIVIHFISYGGKGKLVALVSEDVVPDPLQLCQDCADALQLMKQAAHGTSVHSS